MSDVYKIQYNGMTLAYPGWNGYVGWENTNYPFQRYETTLFKSDNGLGVSAGTLSQPFSAFDEIGVRCCWADSRETYGCNWLWFPKTQFTASTGNQELNYMMADSVYYIWQSNMNWSNVNNTFTVLNDQSTKWWGMYSPTNTNATIGATNNANRHNIVSEIVGVKYQ